LPSTIEKLHQERKGQKFTVLLVNVKESAPKVTDWVKDKGVTPAVVLDRDGAVTALYRVSGTPTVVIVGRDGKMVARALGPQPWNTGLARQLLDILVKAFSP
jgi:hypothetical protein